MTNAEFAEVIAFLEQAVGKPIGQTPADAFQRTKVYFGMLGDLPLDVLRAAAEQSTLVEDKFNPFPSIALLRRLATTILAGRKNATSSGEAWQLAYAAACKIDPDNNGVFRGADGQLYDSQTAYRLAKLPPIVAEAVRRFGGLKLLANSDGKYARQQFVKVFEDVIAKESDQRLLPAALRNRIDQLGSEPKQLPMNMQVLDVAGKIGLQDDPAPIEKKAIPGIAGKIGPTKEAS